MILYRVVCKNTKTLVEFDKAYDVGVYMLGRAFIDYILLKSTEEIDKLLTPSSYNIFELIKELENL